jgi:adenosylhomocysteine nucleosidase
METGAITLVCFALPDEARLFRPLARTRPGVRILVTGMGRRNAEATMRAWFVRHRPGVVLTCGFAGGLDPALKHGAVVFEAESGFALAEVLVAAGARPGRFYCAERIAVTPEEKRRLHQATGADAVEMESGAIRAVCHEHGVPAATVRVISDTADEALPLDFNQLATPAGRMDFAKLAWAIACAPGTIRDLLRLQRQTRAAAEKLAGVLARITAV